MKKLCIGLNGSMDEIKQIVENIDCVGSIYTSDCIKNTTGGRSGGIIRTMDQIKEIAAYLNSRNIDYFITNNHTVFIYNRSEPEFWSGYKDHILELQETGVKGMVVGHPFFIEFIKKHTNLEVCVSTTAEISSVRSAKYYEDMGADMICPSYNINYNLDLLAAIKGSLRHATIKLLVNEFCLGDCIYRRYHQNSYISNTNLDKEYGFVCHKTVISRPERILQNNAIRPEDLNKYFAITENFKISLREPPFYDSKRNLEVVKAYSDECFGGNYMDLLSQRLSQLVKIPNRKLTDLHAVKSACDKKCDSCDVCRKIYEAALVG